MEFFLLESLGESLAETYESTAAGAQAGFYALALLVVGCLALPRRARGPAISGALCLFWLWMGIGLIGEPPFRQSARAWLGCLVLVQSAMFLWSGVFRRRLHFVPRAEAGPFAGSLVLAYTLGIFPLLGEVLDLLEIPWISLPFPGLLFSLGLLLFMAAPVPRHVLAIPLVWAAAGGDGLFTEMNAGAFVNVAALVALLFLLVPPAVEREKDGDLHIEGIYERARRHHRGYGLILWGVLLASCLFVYLALEGPRQFSALFGHLAASSITTLVIAGALWLVMPAWFNLGFRYLAWGMVRVLQAVYVGTTWMTARRERVLLALAALALIAWQTGIHVTVWSKWDESIELLVWSVLVLFIVYSVYRARRSLVILPFSDGTIESGEKEKEIDAERREKSLALRLRNELVSIAALYKTIDEALPEKRGKVTESSMLVEDVGDAILETIGPDSMVKIRGLEVPIGLIFRIVGRVVHGPRLTGSLQKEGDRLLLMAELSGGRWGTVSWKIREEEVAGSSDEAPRDEGRIVQRMIEQLACRMIARIGGIGSPRWEAIQHFNEGLRAYRETQLAEKDVCPALRKAEGEFFQALREDGSFTLCHYDLGVIYGKLGEARSAEAAFRRCLAEDPTWSAAYYSLAEIYLGRGDYTRAAIYARKSLETASGDARAWNLRGVARETAYRLRNPHTQLPSGMSWDFEIATALAWRSLCLASLKTPSAPPRRTLELAGLCTTNLAILRMGESRGKVDGSGQQESCQIARQALYLSPQTPWYHLILGEALLLVGNPKEAQTELYRAFGDSLEPIENAERWAYQLVAAVQLAACDGDSEGAQTEIVRAVRNFLDVAAPPEALTLTTGIRARLRVGGKSYAAHLQGCEDVLDGIPLHADGVGGAYLQNLKSCLGLLGQLDSFYLVQPASSPQWSREERLWRQAQILIRIGRVAIGGPYPLALNSVRQAIGILEQLGENSWPTRQIERQGLRSLLAKACMSEWRRTRNKFLLREALEAADQAVAERPESAARHWIRGEVYCALEDFEQAASERAAALELAPSLEMLHSPEEIAHVASSYLEPSMIYGAEQVIERSKQARDFFQRLLEQIESKPLARGEVESDLQIQIHACVHYWLGVFHERLDERTLAAYHFRISHAMDYEPVDTALHLGKIYAEAGLSKEAEQSFREVIRWAEQEPGAKDGPPRVSPGQAAESYFGLVDVLVKQGRRNPETRQLLLKVLPLKVELKAEWPSEAFDERFCSTASGVFGEDRKVTSMTEKLLRETRLSPSAEAYHQLVQIYEEALLAA